MTRLTESNFRKQTYRFQIPYRHFFTKDTRLDAAIEDARHMFQEDGEDGVFASTNSWHRIPDSTASQHG